MKKQTALTILASVLVLTLSGTGMAFAQKKVRLAYVEWDCAAASTHVVKAVLQEKMGYNVEILPVAAAAMWQAVATGNVDGMVTGWLPATHADYYNSFQNRIEDLGPIVGGAKLGWAVPSYVTIDSIEEINEHAAKFKNRIVGIDPGAGLMRLSEQAMKDYKLNRLQLVEGSGATMTAALSTAIRRNEWVVVTAWSPHWMFGTWDLKYLDDPRGSLGEEEFIHTIVRKGLKKDMPEVYNLLNNFAWEDPNQLQMVMAWDQQPNSDRYENAKRFIAENEEQVNGWIR
ncbi:glycine betaine ABC transporter substrate-binding protein [Desulfobotulus sp. H1]|uniref:Glycine betaine ABC transporter substrate-binding protein n=1 Tax=Desulfobotulus pelophilus TaxID=2823377 RepID=A0ABT3N9G3_9BACT|nr:glycine betaine ABC transporter substrate-binding protein [Desulfobotulus pelophilus]MCW7754098.1 glycine betaine ABC transporter substrate-binding protein [Desulfobotulus pelophilus]